MKIGIMGHRLIRPALSFQYFLATDSMGTFGNSSMMNCTNIEVVSDLLPEDARAASIGARKVSGTRTRDG